VQILDRVLESVAKALSPEAVRKLLDLRADAEVQRLVDDLADKANEGVISPNQKADYESLMAASEIICLLQAKGKIVLAGSAST
jgi:hypothetical protein